MEECYFYLLFTNYTLHKWCYITQCIYDGSFWQKLKAQYEVAELLAQMKLKCVSYKSWQT